MNASWEVCIDEQMCPYSKRHVDSRNLRASANNIVPSLTDSSTSYPIFVIFALGMSSSRPPPPKRILMPSFVWISCLYPSYILRPAYPPLLQQSAHITWRSNIYIYIYLVLVCSLRPYSVPSRFGKAQIFKYLPIDIGLLSHVTVSTAVTVPIQSLPSC
jgi:hypothetical protein